MKSLDCQEFTNREVERPGDRWIRREREREKRSEEKSRRVHWSDEAREWRALRDMQAQ